MFKSLCYTLVVFVFSGKTNNKGSKGENIVTYWVLFYSLSGGAYFLMKEGIFPVCAAEIQQFHKINVGTLHQKI